MSKAHVTPVRMCVQDGAFCRWPDDSTTSYCLLSTSDPAISQNKNFTFYAVIMVTTTNSTGSPDIFGPVSAPYTGLYFIQTDPFHRDDLHHGVMQCCRYSM